MTIAPLIRCLPLAWRERHRDQWYAALDWARHMRRWVIRPALPCNADGRVYVNLGCGRTRDPRFTNVDAVRLAHVHFVARVERLPMFRDGSVDFVYCSHCLEHIPYQRTVQVLREWVRILRPGGVLRLAVPDFRAIVEVYTQSGGSVPAVQSCLLGGNDSIHNVHHALFDAPYLRSLMSEAGLADVREWTPGADGIPCFKDYSSHALTLNGRPVQVSLNLEGVKA